MTTAAWVAEMILVVGEEIWTENRQCKILQRPVEKKFPLPLWAEYTTFFSAGAGNQVPSPLMGEG